VRPSPPGGPPRPALLRRAGLRLPRRRRAALGPRGVPPRSAPGGPGVGPGRAPGPTAVLGPGSAAPPGLGERGLLAVRERPARPDRGPVPGLPDGRGPGGWDPRDPPGPGRRPAAPPRGPGRPGRPDRRPAG